MPQDPIGGVIRNLLTIQRLGNAVNLEAQLLVRALIDDIAAQVVKVDLTVSAEESFKKRRLERFLGDVEALAGKTFDEVHRILRRRLTAIGVQQGEWAEAQLARSIGSAAVDVRSGRLSAATLRSILDSEPIRGELMRDWFTTQSATTVRRVRQEVQLGMVQNETIDQLVRRIRGRSVGRGKFAGGVLQVATRDAETIVRTAVNYIANRAHVEVYRANEDILDGMEVVATLDSRTTPVCQAKDGEVLPLDTTDVPPYHPRCRTIVVARVGWEKLGIEPPEPGQRASADGPVSSSVNYEGWLRGQSAAEQDDILGPSRGKLFRDGKVTLRELVKTDGKLVTVEELRAKVGA